MSCFKRETKSHVGLFNLENNLEMIKVLFSADLSDYKKKLSCSYCVCNSFIPLSLKSSLTWKKDENIENKG